MPLPIIQEREWDEGLYDGWLYDGRRAGPPAVPKGGGANPPILGDHRPGANLAQKK